MDQLNKYKQKLEEEKQEEKENDPIMMMSEVAEELNKVSTIERYPTGLDMLDEHLRLNKKQAGGWADGDLVVVSGLPGNGKTLLSSTLAFYAARQAFSALYFSYEVNIYNLWQSFLAMGGKKDEMIFAPFQHTTGKIEWIEKKIKEAKEKYCIKVVVIDHVGFLAPIQKPGNSNMSQNYSMYLTQIVRELKTIAVKENIIIILPVHMVKSATDDPTLRDIGHSGGPAQEADVVLLVAREESKDKVNSYYTEFTKVILAKNRAGGTTPKWWMKKEDGLLITEHNKPLNQNGGKIY